MQVEGVVATINSEAGSFTGHLRGISPMQGSRVDGEMCWALVRGLILGYGDALGVSGAVVAGDIANFTGSGDDSCTCGRTGGRGAGYCRCC